ncbi:hypothetical protein AB9P05_01010 [Roseivirga sp. BDSF3-8]|uniref:hypothetical protein n=1 Tax=Roseivirga sp. BDSF3-8 TaxID=3241598 RepID=UPI00353233BA
MRKIDVYIGEIETQIEFAKLSYAFFLKSYEDDAVLPSFMSIHHFLIHVSNIDKLLDVRSNNFRKEVFGDQLIQIDIRQFRRLRNHLEHFDERLDSWIKEYDDHTFFDMNFVTGTRGYPDKASLRALDGMNFKFQGENYDLESLYNSILELAIEINKLSG